MNNNHNTSINHNTDDYDQAFSQAETAESQLERLKHELKMAQKRAADAGDQCEALGRKLKLLQAERPTVVMLEAGRDYVWENERSAGVAFYPSMNSIEKIYLAMREAV